MHDVAGVRSGERVRQRRSEIEHLSDAKGSLRQSLSQRAPSHELHRDVGDVTFLPDAINCDDVRVIEGGRESGFLFEPLQVGGIACGRSREHFECNLASELHISRAIHLAHAARAQQRRDLINADLLADQITSKPADRRVQPSAARKSRRDRRGCRSILTSLFVRPRPSNSCHSTVKVALHGGRQREIGGRRASRSTLDPRSEAPEQASVRQKRRRSN